MLLCPGALFAVSSVKFYLLIECVRGYDPVSVFDDIVA